MRGLAWSVVLVAACGEVNEDNPDASTGSESTIDASLDAPPAAPGTIRWARSLSALQGYGIADGSAGLVVTGGITAPTDLGGGTMIPVGAFDMVISGWTLDGTHVYSVRHGDLAGEFAFLQSNDSLGNPLVYGVHSSQGTANLGLGQFTPGGGTDGHVGRYGVAAPSWVQRISGPGEDKFLASAPGPGSTIYAGGYFELTTNFNSGMLTSVPARTGFGQADSRDAFFARFNTFTGNVELTKVYANTGRSELLSLATNPNTFVVAGVFDNTMSLGGATAQLTSAGALDVFVAKVDAAGDAMWAVRFGGPAGEDRDCEVAVDAAGDVYVTGSFIGQVAFGAINLVSAGGTTSDIFVTKLRGTDGSVAWAVQLGSPGNDTAQTLTLDQAGHVAITGNVGGSLDGGATLGGVDAFIAVFDRANGNSHFRKVFSTAGDDRLYGLTYASNGEMYAIVQIGGPFDFGVPMMGSPNPATALLRIAP